MGLRWKEACCHLIFLDGNLENYHMEAYRYSERFLQRCPGYLLVSKQPHPRLSALLQAEVTVVRCERILERDSQNVFVRNIEIGLCDSPDKSIIL